MTLQNPVALAANTLRTLSETGTQAITGLGQSLARANSQLLSGLASGAPPFPLPLGLPPIPGLGSAAQSSHRGNPNGNGILGNGGIAGLPSLQQLLPGVQQLLAPLAALENSVLPPGVPRPTQVLLSGFAPAAAPTPTIPVETGIVGDGARPGTDSGLEGLNGFQRGARGAGLDVGIQLV